MTSLKKYQSFEYIPLEKYAYYPASLNNETPLRLIAFSGGKESNKDNIYYYQFIAINEANGDTVRILTPLISVPTENDQKTYTTPLQFDAEKRIDKAVYEVKDSSLNSLIVASYSLPSSGELDTAAVINSFTSPSKAKEFVVINKSISWFANPKYATAIGTLYFKEVPW